MRRKGKNYIREWRAKAKLTQKQVVDRLREMAGDNHEFAELRLPTTEASLSRIENGQQNYTIGTLEALAEILGADEPGWLLTRNPLKEGKVIDLTPYQLDKDQEDLAVRVIEQMFGHGEGERDAG